MTKLSIIIPIYKAEAYIERCVRSLMEQTMIKDIEFIFINDCSPDNSIQILKNVIKEYPNRKNQIKIIENEHNLGVSEVRKLGVKIAKGEYIGWCDSDDWVESYMYEKMYKATCNNEIDIIVSNFIIEKKDSQQQITFIPCTSPQDCITNFYKGYYFPGSLWQQICRKKNIERSINSITNVNYGEDIYTLILTYYYSRTIGYVNQYLYHYNALNESSLLHNTNYSYESWILQKENIDKITNILYSKNGYKIYHVAINALKLAIKTHFKKSFKNIFAFYYTYPECYKDFNIYSFTPSRYKIQTYLIHNIYILYWLYYNKKWNDK